MSNISKSFAFHYSESFGPGKQCPTSPLSSTSKYLDNKKIFQRRIKADVGMIHRKDRPSS